MGQRVKISIAPCVTMLLGAMSKESKLDILKEGDEKKEEEKKIEWECKHGCNLTSWKQFTSLSGLTSETLEGLPLVDFGLALHESIKHRDFERIDEIRISQGVGFIRARSSLMFLKMQEAIKESNYDIQKPVGEKLN